MGEFLQQVSQANSTNLIVMVLDGATSHEAKELNIPANIRVLASPPYAPEPSIQPHGRRHPATGAGFASRLASDSKGPVPAHHKP